MKSRKLWLIILVSFHLFLLINLRFTAWPEMILYPWLQSQGFKLYQDIINPYTPGLLLTLFSWFKLVGFSLLNLKLLTWLTIIVIDLLIFSIAGLPALIFFILLQPIFDGNGLWFDLFLTPILLLAYKYRSPFFISLAFFIKQSAVYLFILFFKKLPRLIFFTFFFAFIFGLIFYFQDILKDHLFWSYQYPFFKLPFLPGHKDWGSLNLWLLSLFPFVLLFAYRFSQTKKLNWLLDKKDPAPWVLLTFLFVFPRFELFHLQPALAFLALFFAKTLCYSDHPHCHSEHSRGISRACEPHIRGRSFGRLRMTVLLAPYLILVWHRQIKLFWHQPTRFFEPEIFQTATQIKSEINDQSIFLYQAPDQLYYLLNTQLNKPWAAQFSWYLSVPQLSQRIINSLDQNPPQYCFIAPEFHSNQQLKSWVDQHCQEKILETNIGDLYEYH